MASIQAAANSVVASIGAAATAARAFRNQRASLALEERKAEIREQKEARAMYEAKTARKRANVEAKRTKIREQELAYKKAQAEKKEKEKNPTVEEQLKTMGIDPSKTNWRYT